MPLEFKLPDLGEGIHEGEVLKVLVSVGDTVTEGDSILEIETDKATVEIPSPLYGHGQGDPRQRGGNGPCGRCAHDLRQWRGL